MLELTQIDAKFCAKVVQTLTIILKRGDLGLIKDMK
tara:strand:- start:157 stop:264 length:108 start_codon:yes stop_codon:yes gene_type:complete